jgi:type I restriction enzyme S subunit
MEQRNKLLPKLRFSEFQENWKIKELDGYIKLLSGYAFKGDDISDIKNGIALLRGINITEGRIRHSKDIDRYYNKTVVGLEKYLLKENDLVLSMDGSKVGKNVALISKEDIGSLLIQRVARIRAKDSSDIRFIYLNIFSERFHRYVDKVNTSSGIPHISSKQIKEFNIGFPSLSEQQKIASFLTDVDDKITKLTKKKELLEHYKKGVMQKIFNQELRFKDDNGNNYPIWVEKKLDDLGSTLNGLTGKTKENFGSGKPYIQYKQIFDSSKINIDNCGLVDITITDKQTKVQYGDVFFTTSSETPNEIGTASVLLDSVDEMYLNSFCFGFRVNQSILYPSFSQFLFRSSDFRKKMIPLAQGSTRYNISKSSFVKLKVSLPSIAEQTKIANFLSDIDVKIEALNIKIENSKSFKKGLLQQMFV